jgi:hypothetical protein
MRYLTLFALILTLSSCGTATNSKLQGTPDQDAIISQLRTMFMGAQAPTEQDLKLGQIWRCTMRSAYKNNYGLNDKIEHFFVKSEPFISDHGNSNIKQYAYTFVGLSGNVGKYGLVMRRYNNDLIGEWNAPGTVFPGSYSVPSIADPKKRAYGYEYCKLAEL